MRPIVGGRLSGPMGGKVSPVSFAEAASMPANSGRYEGQAGGVTDDMQLADPEMVFSAGEIPLEASPRHRKNFDKDLSLDCIEQH